MTFNFYITKWIHVLKSHWRQIECHHDLVGFNQAWFFLLQEQLERAKHPKIKPKAASQYEEMVDEKMSHNYESSPPPIPPPPIPPPPNPERLERLSQSYQNGDENDNNDGDKVLICWTTTFSSDSLKKLDRL